MDLFYSIWTMMIASFFIQYIVMSLIMTNVPSNITFSVGKFYISVIMAILMGFIEVSMFDYHMKTLHITYYLSLFIGFVIFLYLYKSQAHIDDDEYLKEMIEHHSMALLTSEEILQKTKSERVKKLADNIVSTQAAEIDYMKRLLVNK
jgi:hypothetical protein